MREHKIFFLEKIWITVPKYCCYPFLSGALWGGGSTATVWQSSLAILGILSPLELLKEVCCTFSHALLSFSDCVRTKVAINGHLEKLYGCHFSVKPIFRLFLSSLYGPVKSPIKLFKINCQFRRCTLEVPKILIIFISLD